MAQNRFEFADATGGFDNHILNTIPGYDTLLNLTVNLSNHWINEDDLPIIDIGGSTGKLLSAVQMNTGINVKDKFYVVDPTEFKDQKTDNQYISFIKDDAENYLKTVTKQVQIFYSVFTLQFLSKPCREMILAQVSEKMSDDGAFFVAEKFYTDDSEYQELYSVILRDMKRKHFSDKDILDKDKKLLKHLKLRKECDFIEEMERNKLKPVKYWQSLHFNAYICGKIT